MIDGVIKTARGCFGVRCHGDPSAPLVLCLHGFPDDASTYDQVAETLAASGYRVVAPYLRGYAPSPLEGSLALQILADDLIAQVDALSPDRPVRFIGQDYGAQVGYAALSRSAGRFASAVMLAGAHPAAIGRNIRRFPRQWWMSRYILLFQAPGYAERLFARRDFAYLDTLWRRWSPGFRPAPTHMERVKATMRRSMPAPIAMYRAGGFDIGDDPIAVPLLFIAGADDGCLMPGLADGQERLFTGEYRREIWPDVGHFPQLEQSDRVADAAARWFARTSVA